MTQPIFPVPSTVINPALGDDLAGIDDLTPSMAEVSGRTALAQSLARRLITPRGALIYDVNFGYDLNQWVNADVAQSDVSQIQGYIRQEMLKDQRVISAQVTAQYVGANQVDAALTGIVANPNPYPTGVMVFVINIQDGTGPFTLTVTVSAINGVIIQNNLSTST